jgi:pyridoxine kinase
MTKTALSILSHVVHGYVGNRCVVFPLQYNGWDVDAINTTNYSNHPGYGSFKGINAGVEDIEAILKGLEDIQLIDNYNLIMTGYCPTASITESVIKKVTTMLVLETKWIFDPVLGDGDRLYVPSDIVRLCKRALASGNVSLTTPNHFEFELLTECKVHDMASLVVAIDTFRHLYRVEHVVVSSMVLNDTMISVAFDNDHAFYLPIDRVQCHFNGSGDLFAALLANALYDNEWKLTPAVLSDALVKIHNVLLYTYREAKKVDGDITTIKDLDIIGLRNFLLQDNRTDVVDQAVYLK